MLIYCFQDIRASVIEFRNPESNPARFSGLTLCRLKGSVLNLFPNGPRISAAYEAI